MGTRHLYHIKVSTHSRPKAAGITDGLYKRPVNKFQHTAARRRLARRRHVAVWCEHCFNTQPPEGGWGTFKIPANALRSVSTHSRPKAAGTLNIAGVCNYNPVSTHSRPKAAGRYR